jgi:hypothetical protein
MSRVFRSRVYGRMNKQGRRRLGLQGHRREDVWRMMAEQEASLAATAWWRSLPGWRRLWLRLLVWLRKAPRFGRVGQVRAGRSRSPSRAATAPPAATGAATQGR